MCIDYESAIVGAHAEAGTEQRSIAMIRTLVWLRAHTSPQEWHTLADADGLRQSHRAPGRAPARVPRPQPATAARAPRFSKALQRRCPLSLLLPEQRCSALHGSRPRIPREEADANAAGVESGLNQAAADGREGERAREFLLQAAGRPPASDRADEARTRTPLCFRPFFLPCSVRSVFSC